VEPVNLEPELVRELQSSLLLFFTGASHHSWTILKEQEQSARKPGSGTVEYLHEIRSLAEPMKAALLSGELREFGLLLHEGWKIKKRLSSKISNDHIDGMYESALRNGALGGKITGAGGGGFLLLYCQQQHQKKVREALVAGGAREMGFEFDFQGAQVVADDPFIDGDENGGMRWTFLPSADNVAANRHPSPKGS
jgi:D-glycero-alpha-D-manno-heptose-7-phosphate kinase